MSHSAPSDAVGSEAASSWLDGSDPALLPVVVREAWAELAGPIEMKPLSGGLLHRSFHLRASGVEYVLQRVSDVFSPAIDDNIARVTEHLRARSFPAPRFITTRNGAPSADLGDQGRWRLMTHLGGVSFEAVQSHAQLRSAGELVGRFHGALSDFERSLQPMGIPYRDTDRYLAAMREALARDKTHRLAPEMRPLANRVLAAFDEMGEAPDVPTRVIHGDLKLSNVLFEGHETPARDRAFALVDFDTLMRGPLWMELGDAWRSWCNTGGEGARDAAFDMQGFEVSWAGFCEGIGCEISAPERASLASAPERIALELCARFVTDAYEESYFAWDATRFERSGEHQALRAHGQWSFYCAARDARPDRARALGVAG